MWLGEKESISHDHDNVMVPGDGDCENPRISANGRWAVFQSLANNLLDEFERPPNNNDDEVFVVDLAKLDDPNVEPLRIILTPEGDDEEQGGNLRGPDISPDGRWIIFTSANLLYNVLPSGEVSPNLVELLIHDRDVSGDGDFDESGDVETEFLLLEDPAFGNSPPFADGLSAVPARFSRAFTEDMTLQQLVVFQTDAQDLNAGMTPVDDHLPGCSVAQCGNDIYVRRIW